MKIKFLLSNIIFYYCLINVIKCGTINSKPKVRSPNTEFYSNHFPQEYHVSETERRALLELYQRTNGLFWNNHSNWLIGDPCENQWYGIGCDQLSSGKSTVTKM